MNLYAYTCSILANRSFITLKVPAFLSCISSSCIEMNCPSLPSFLAHVRLLNSQGIFKPSKMAWVLLLIIPGSWYCGDNLSSYWPVRGSVLTWHLHQHWACAGNGPRRQHIFCCRSLKWSVGECERDGGNFLFPFLFSFFFFDLAVFTILRYDKFFHKTSGFQHLEVLFQYYLKISS